MDLDEALETLEKAGTAQYRKVYARHGVSGKMFGVSYAVLKTLVKKIKSDHALAQQLWATENHDARILATMIADPDQVTAAQLEHWAKALDSYPLCDALASFVAKTPHALKKAQAWQRKKQEWLASAGWTVCARLALDQPDLADDYFAEHLTVIEEGIHQAPNRVRHSMNGALIAIGLRNPALTKQALAAAARIGTVEVDHGETACQTPSAAEYIARALARRKQ